jgi:ABC-type polysaccharide transport system permease subunit
MLIIAIESIIIGIIVCIIGTILFNEILNNRYKLMNIKPTGISFAFFTTGVILHVIMNMLNCNN